MRCDLHIHSCLSPCSDLTMVPNEVVKYSPKIAAICDHNSGENVLSFYKVFEKHSKLLIPGIEIQSVEDVHILGYFNKIENLLKVSKVIAEHLPKISYDPEKLGYQLKVNERDEFTSLETIPLGFPTDLPLKKVVELIIENSGIPVYAHISRRFGVLYQLGLFPDTSKIKIAEVTNLEEYKIACNHGLIPISSSDAHSLNQIGVRYSIIENAVSSIQEFLIALVNGKVKTIWDY
ncbi:PHP-associated domain-containing protein [Thermosipho atlanticus]|uniref:Polymerase/histidinol phosphatase N-terminal domain-containing protein n=1 Tax=Thermosipho atlanticus DSM 15807 TaxID=1123380 RepID=A0A1M5TK37_9BACT|nr:PHP-associated domain-containing protein [Thermosipho atlanticus]SHH51041.1 hypothetical protein SAMN02745199_1357 [Thermosipho atlanticus DSM 15807]